MMFRLLLSKKYNFDFLLNIYGIEFLNRQWVKPHCCTFPVNNRLSTMQDYRWRSQVNKRFRAGDNKELKHQVDS